MSVKVNPPPALRIPDQFFNDPDTRAFFEQQKEIIFQLWNRTGGATDFVAGKQNIILAAGDLVLDSSAWGSLIVVYADTAAISITLPAITSATIGESVDIAIMDATFDTTVLPAASESILGDSSVIMTQQFMSIQYTSANVLEWIGT